MGCTSRVLSIILIVGLFLTLVSGLTASAYINDEIEERQQELAEIEKRRRAESSALQQRLNREALLKEELKALDIKINELRVELEVLAEEIVIVEGDIEQAELELADAEERLKNQHDLLKLRLRAMQKHGIVSYIEVLFESSSFSDFLTRLQSLSILASNDMRLIDEFQAERDVIQGWKDELEENRRHLISLHDQVAANESELARASMERVVILGELQEEITYNLKAIEDLEREAEQLDELIRKLIAESLSQFSGVEGKLHWPIEPPTWISSGYGWRRDPFSGAQAWHGGIDIAPHGGAANYILAAANGRIIFSGWNGGYGNCIMIDHGAGTVTLYAHMSSLLVQKDDIVAKGQRIARAGTTGYSTGVHLHFEVREYNMKPIRHFPSGNPDHRYNPMNYF